MTIDPTTDSTMDETVTVVLQTNFYRDGFNLVKLSISLVLLSIIMLLAVSMYFFAQQILPTKFAVQDNFRVQEDVDLSYPYLSISDVLQWVAVTIPEILSNNFVYYEECLQNNAKYFTMGGWEKYQDIVKVFINSTDIKKNKYFVTAQATGAPVVLNQGVVDNRYAWWIQLPVSINYISSLQNSSIDNMQRSSTTSNLYIQILVVRLSTKDNLEGIKIDNIIVQRP